MFSYSIKLIYIALLITFIAPAIASATTEIIAPEAPEAKGAVTVKAVVPSVDEINKLEELDQLEGSDQNNGDNGILVVSREVAEMLKLEPSSACSDHLIVSEEPESPDACTHNEPNPFEAGLEDDLDPKVLVTLDMDSYKLGSRAMRYVEKNKKVMAERIPERFKRYLGRSSRYLRMMRNILKEEGIPEDIAYLPLIESGFYTHAYSRSRASGPWQFIRSTGKRYGLKIDWWVDERRDPVKSTYAAARYLKDLHERFGSWSLSLAAYNAGEGKIQRALKVTKAKDFWSVMRTMAIKRETFNYVPKFIAAREIALDPEAYGLANIVYQEDLVYDEVIIEFPMSVDIVAKTAETTEKIIKDLNPELRRWSTPPVDKYSLKIPRGSRETFLANLPKIPAEQRVTVKVHIVRSGDTVSQIAHKYGVHQRSIKTYNRLGHRSLIRPGQRLIIPVSYKTSAK